MNTKLDKKIYKHYYKDSLAILGACDEELNEAFIKPLEIPLEEWSQLGAMDKLFRMLTVIKKAMLLVKYHSLLKKNCTEKAFKRIIRIIKRFYRFIATFKILFLLDYDKKLE